MRSRLDLVSSESKNEDVVCKRDAIASKDASNATNRCTTPLERWPHLTSRCPTDASDAKVTSTCNAKP